MAGERQGAIGEDGRELWLRGQQGRDVVRVQTDNQPVRHHGSPTLADARVLHRPFEPAQHDDRPDPRPEQSSRLAFEEPFQESLDRGEGSHVGGGV
jgi:hypothetical protein